MDRWGAADAASQDLVLEGSHVPLLSSAWVSVFGRYEPRPGQASPGSATLGWNLELSALQALLRRAAPLSGAGCSWLARITMAVEQRHSGSLEALSMQVIDG